ncbi:MAG: hypothetical protein DRP45_10935, partial [Candidatus Zixiibacteriota bacterium]
IGSLPSSLDALVTNPGSYATWDGPYINDAFSTDGSSSEFKNDAWGTAYSYAGGITVSSTGDSSTITREIANSVAALLYNSISVVVTDLDNTPPGTTYDDSVRLVLSYPNGSGSITSDTKYPAPDGFAEFDSIPIGIHVLKIIYLPTSDTLIRKVIVGPGQDFYSEISLSDNQWSGS